MQVNNFDRVNCSLLRLIFIVVLIASSPLAGIAQNDARESGNYELTESGQRYLDAIRGSRVEAEIGYFDPTQPPPELTLDQPFAKPEEEKAEADGGLSVGGLGTIVVTTGILAGLLWLFVLYGGGVTLRLSGDPDDRVLGKSSTGDGAEPLVDGTRGLDGVIAIRDRRLALTALLSLVLRKAADDSGMKIERSWTAREAARRLPDAWPHRAPLMELIGAVELSYFGGRPADEALFQTQLNASRRMMGAGV